MFDGTIETIHEAVQHAFNIPTACLDFHQTVLDDFLQVALKSGTVSCLQPALPRPNNEAQMEIVETGWGTQIS